MTDPRSEGEATMSGVKHPVRPDLDTLERLLRERELTGAWPSEWVNAFRDLFELARTKERDEALEKAEIRDHVHDWRLRGVDGLTRPATVEEEAARWVEIRLDQEEAQRYNRAATLAPLNTIRIGVKRRWYCTRCRVFETTEHLDETL